MNSREFYEQSLTDLPDELITLIFSYCGDWQLNFLLTCTRFRNFGRDVMLAKFKQCFTHKYHYLDQVNIDRHKYNPDRYWYHKFQEEYKEFFSKIPLAHVDFYQSLIEGDIARVSDYLLDDKNDNDVRDSMLYLESDHKGKNSHYCLALEVAVQNGYLAISELLIEAGADVNQVNKDGETLLHFAAFNGHVKIIHELVKLGLDVNKGNKYGITPLIAVAQTRYNRTEVINTLVELGADVDKGDNNGWTPVFHAAASSITQKLENLNALLRNRADVNKPTIFAMTPIYIAAKYYLEDVAELLLNFGADPSYADGDGNSPLHVLIEKYCTLEDIGWINALITKRLELGDDFCKLNKEEISPKPSLKYLQCKERISSLILKLIEHGANLDKQNNKGVSPMGLAEETCEPEFIAALVSAKVRAEHSIQDEVIRISLQ